MNFREAEAYLYSLGNEVEAMKLGLDNIRTLVAALGDPQNDYLKVQVAGTNGKGSVCAFLNSICLEAGIKTGMYTSPHLISITERVRINGVDISEDDFARFANHVRETAEKLLAEERLTYIPTYFEQVTAIALLAFSEAKVQLAILETGLGGRLDATTAANAEICAITRIDLDHQEYLGETIEEIGAEKAATIRTSTRSVVIGEQSPEAMAVIDKRIKGRNTTGRECAPVVRRATSLTPELPTVALGLPGIHQQENAKVAILLAEVLREYFPISADNIASGLADARHTGRLEYSGLYLFDGAHNLGGAKVLAAYLSEFEKRPITLVFGAMEGKDVSGMAALLFPLAEKVVLTAPKNSRAMSAEKILASISTVREGETIIVTSAVAEALAKANEITEDDSLILVTGSLYLVGEAKRIIGDMAVREE
ncbi:MAG: folylpolyglutamate synthase/dihydrofolate synthase family protein [Pyrinomonadaceae bacterium]